MRVEVFMSLLLLNKRKRSNAIIDPYWDNVVVYLKGDGANNSTDIIDSSPNTKTISRFGDTKISTTQSKYGGSSIYFDGNGDYLTFADSSAFNFGTSNFTIEMWYYPIGQTQYSSIFNLDGLDYPLCLYHGTLVNGNRPIIGFGSDNSSSFISASFGSTPNNSWYHLAVTRENDTFRLFVNGILKDTQTASNSIGNAGDCHICKNGTFFLSMYLDSFRITNGIARYTANFNPETDTYLA
jgi:hypothetical protein